MGQTNDQLSPFRSPWRKVARAKTHIEDFKANVRAFQDAHPYECFTEINPGASHERLHKLKLVTALPEILAEILGDALNNLREALDYACHAIAVAAGKVRPGSAYFPFAGAVDELDGKIAWNCKDIPQEIWPLLRAFKPYKGGNDLLWALNRIANKNKHAILIPHSIVVESSRKLGLQHSDLATWVDLVSPPVRLEYGKDQVVVITRSDARTDSYHKYTISVGVSFDQVEVVADQEVAAVLDKFTGIVESILLALEAECKRLGFVK